MLAKRSIPATARAIILALLMVAVLITATPTEARAHLASGDMTYGGGCGAAIDNRHDSTGIYAKTSNINLASADCKNMRVAINWYTGWGYASCVRESGSNRTVTVSTNDTGCTFTVVTFQDSRHQLKRYGSTAWSSTCKLSHGVSKNCRF